MHLRHAIATAHDRPAGPVRPGDRVSHPSCPDPLLVMSVTGADAYCLRLDGSGGTCLVLPVGELAHVTPDAC